LKAGIQGKEENIRSLNGQVEALQKELEHIQADLDEVVNQKTSLERQKAEHIRQLEAFKVRLHHFGFDLTSVNGSLIL